MDVQPRVQHLLEEMLDSGLTPEEACRDCPELLPLVLKEWRRKLACDAELDALFASSEPDAPSGDLSSESPSSELPRIPGHELQGVLGRGGMGVVFKARHVRLNRTVAIKMLLNGAHGSADSRERFLREAEAVASLRHPNIVQVYELGDQGGHSYFTMEFMEGGNLAQKLGGTPQSPRDAATLLATLAEAVEAAHHSGIVHRDLKPSNVLLTADGTPKVSDFGLARRMAGDSGLTWTGTAVGTPSYMAPEQAEARPLKWGPTVDIYALGAILYELLTGRPPFRAETAAETVRQVISQDPVPPSRLNGRVPRDLETVCLKCLDKNPARRYSSAEKLADDLHRVLDGKPVLARPVGSFERAAKWSRRRPALAMLVLTLFIALVASIGVGNWLQQRENSRKVEKAAREGRARESIETAIDNAYKSGRANRWEEAERILAVAPTHLAEVNTEELRLRIAQTETELQFARSLEGARTQGEIGVVSHFYVAVTSYPAFVKSYSEAFAAAGFDVEGDPGAAARRIRSAPLAEQIVTALDLWGFAAFRLKNESLQKRLLRIAQLADSDPAWRDHFRDPATWRDKQALLKLAAEASKTARPPLAHHLAITGSLLSDLGKKDEETRLLRDALDRHPEDAWLNWEMAHTLVGHNRHSEAATYFRIVNALRPGYPWLENSLGTSLALAGEYDESVRHFRNAILLEPTNAWSHYNFVLALSRNGRVPEAQAECRRELERNPKNHLAYYALGKFFWDSNRLDEAITMVKKASELKPNDAGIRCNLGELLRTTGRNAEALAAFQKTIEIQAASAYAHIGAGRCLARMGRHEEAVAEYLWIIRELDPAERRAAVEPGAPPAPPYIDARVELTEQLICLGRFKQAGAATQIALELPGLDKSRLEVLERQRDTCQRLAPLEDNLTTILTEYEQLADLATCRALAEWCYQYRGLPATAVRIFEGMFRNQPSLAEDPQAQDRFHAACAAALAGSGYSADVAKLTDQQRSVLRKKALEWLKADRNAWVKRTAEARGGAAVNHENAVHGWLENRDLASVRDPSSLAQLPESERKEWQAFWADITALVPRNRFRFVDEARALVSRKQWANAAENYAQFIKDAPLSYSEIWYEYAAVQLLSGDRQGYRQTCQLVLKGANRAAEMRPYLAARVCTLGANSLEDTQLAANVSAQELMRFEKEFWSLTEQGAIDCRINRFRNAVRLFEGSLRAEAKPGAAVINWLWLALAYQNLGEREQARRWLDKADTWLEAVGGELPGGAERTFGLHLHNWLEAHVLRREMVALLSPPSAD